MSMLFFFRTYTSRVQCCIFFFSETRLNNKLQKNVWSWRRMGNCFSPSWLLFLTKFNTLNSPSLLMVIQERWYKSISPIIPPERVIYSIFYLLLTTPLLISLQFLDMPRLDGRSINFKNFLSKHWSKIIGEDLDSITINSFFWLLIIGYAHMLLEWFDDDTQLG